MGGGRGIDKNDHVLISALGSDDAVTSELRELYSTLQTCLDLRQKYMTRSCQRLEDDPRNSDDWNIYPPPPPPSWPLPSPEELARRKQRELEREADPVAAVGCDFHWEDCKIPGKDDQVRLRVSLPVPDFFSIRD